MLAHEGHVGHVLLDAPGSLHNDRRAGLFDDCGQQIERDLAATEIGMPISSRLIRTACLTHARFSRPDRYSRRGAINMAFARRATQGRSAD